MTAMTVLQNKKEEKVSEGRENLLRRPLAVISQTLCDVFDDTKNSFFSRVL